MTIRKFHPAFVSNVRAQIVEGYITLNGTSAPTVSRGQGFTASRTAVGDYTITLDYPFADFASISAQLVNDSESANVRFLQVHSPDASAGTFKLTIMESAATDTTHPVPADLDGPEIHLRVSTVDKSISKGN